MILNSIKINNIRSIKNLELTFPKATILFFGDVGSGKSSVLKAIEFALFGTMGELSAESLLRRGQKSGSVEMYFTIDGRQYGIHRELKKVIKKDKESITQPKGWLSENGTKTDYSTTELRLKILNLLNYSASRYKATNKKCIDIYRYTVYTPQEEVKQILMASPDERFDILKDALEIEKYEHVIANLEEAKKQLSRDLRNIDMKIASLGAPEQEIPEKKQEIETQENEIDEISLKVKEKNEELKKERAYQEKIQKEFNDLSKQVVKVKGLQDTIHEQAESISQNQVELQELETNISENQNALDSLPVIVLETNKTEEEMEFTIKELRESESEHITEEATTIDDVDKIKTMLINNKCPLCNQEIHERERFEKELATAQEKLKKISLNLEKVRKEIQNQERLLKNQREHAINEKERKNLLKLLKEQQKRNESLKKAIEDSQKKIADIQNKINDVLTLYEIESIEQLETKEKEIESNLKQQKEQVQKVQQDLTEIEKQKSSVETTLKTLKKELKQLEQDVKEKETLKERKRFKTELSDWVSNQLPTLFRDIERTILLSTARDFNEYFKEWFAELVQEANVEININPQDLQPIVHIGGYVSPFEDMSGGEKSALSLAYRLALNQTINSKHPDVKTRDLLILDEPTDGFSEAQVNKMQDVFGKLNT